MKLPLNKKEISLKTFNNYISMHDGIYLEQFIIKDINVRTEIENIKPGVFLLTSYSLAISYNKDNKKVKVLNKKSKKLEDSDISFIKNYLGFDIDYYDLNEFIQDDFVNIKSKTDENMYHEIEEKYIELIPKVPTKEQIKKQIRKDFKKLYENILSIISKKINTECNFSESIKISLNYPKYLHENTFNVNPTPIKQLEHFMKNKNYKLEFNYIFQSEKMIINIKIF